MNISKTLSEKLKSYSLFAGSILAPSYAANGQVVYEDIDPDVVIGGTHPASVPELEQYSIDLNNDGLFDLNLSINWSGTFSNSYSFTEKAAGANVNNLMIPYTVNYIPFMLKMKCGDSIPFPYYQYGFHFGFFAFQNANSAAYNWNNVHDRYIGFNFYVGNEAHWAWVRLDVNTVDSFPNIVIKDYAYELAPNKKIYVCDTAGSFGVEVPVIENNNHAVVYPNPSSGRCIIRLDQPLRGELELRITDALGKEVYTSNFKTNPQQTDLPLNLTHLSPGIYFIQLKSETISISEKWIRE